MRFIEFVRETEPMEKMEIDFMLKTVDHIRVCEDGNLVIIFLEGTEIQCRNEDV